MLEIRDSKRDGPRREIDRRACDRESWRSTANARAAEKVNVISEAVNYWVYRRLSLSCA